MHFDNNNFVNNEGDGGMTRLTTISNNNIGLGGATTTTTIMTNNHKHNIDVQSSQIFNNQNKIITSGTTASMDSYHIID